jgi:hypothetical protein
MILSHTPTIAAALLALACAAAVRGPVTRVSETQHPVPPELAPALPDESACPSGVAWRRTALHAPRVDEYACRPGARPRAERLLVGVSGLGAVAWRRPLVYPSGASPIDLALAGATPGALVLSDLEVVSPTTGETIVPPRTRAIEGEGRAVPVESVQGPAAYLPSSGAVLYFEADVTLVRRDGGLFRVDPRSGVRTLLLPVTADLLGRYDRVESIAPTDDGRFAVLGRRRSTRGPSSVSVAVLDLASGRLVFEETHGDGHACFDAQVVVGTGGLFTFTYRDDTLARRVVVEYRLETL